MKRVTTLDWTGGHVDTIVEDQGSEMTRSWGRYLVVDGAVHDTETGAEKWRDEQVWTAGDTARPWCSRARKRRCSS